MAATYPLPHNKVQETPKAKIHPIHFLWDMRGWRPQYTGVLWLNFFQGPFLYMILSYIPLIENFPMTLCKLLVCQYIYNVYVQLYIVFSTCVDTFLKKTVTRTPDGPDGQFWTNPNICQLLYILFLIPSHKSADCLAICRVKRGIMRGQQPLDGFVRRSIQRRIPKQMVDQVL